MNSPQSPFDNPFRPGAGHPPPYLAGRDEEMEEFSRLLDQKIVTTNLVLTGSRGVGKTVLLDNFKPVAPRKGWMWAGTDLSEAASVSEEHFATRVLADLAPLVSNVVVDTKLIREIGFSGGSSTKRTTLNFELLRQIFVSTPGLASDKLKAVLEVVWKGVARTSAKGIVLAYDEAQNLGDRSGSEEYPLSLLLDVFQSLQRRRVPFLLVMTGLPTLFPKMVEARTFAERMFHVTTLGRLNPVECRDAILKPIKAQACPVRFSEAAVEEIVTTSGGYPYFVQFLCRELYDSYLQQRMMGIEKPTMPVSGAIRKLDSDFFLGRWSRVTDRQRELLRAISMLPNCDDEFGAQEISEKVRESGMRPFSSSQLIQLLGTLADKGLVYRNRHGRYSFAIPLLGGFIRRLHSERA